ncbi:cop9 subunit [Nemania diffusa]|nr:cop9 subunit [Nemania diffusa]
MEQCASTLLAFPPQSDFVDNESYHKAASFHIAQLLKILRERNRDLVAYSHELFNLVDPAVNSLSYLAILHAVMFPSFASNLPQIFILEQITTFMMSFDGRQCRYAGSLLLDLMDAVGSGRILPPRVAVNCLARSILTLDASGTMLTSSHLPLVKLAYNTNNMEPALHVIEKEIVFFPGMSNHETAQYLCDTTLSPPSYISRNTGLTARLKSATVLEYDLMCGMIYSVRREWEKAREAFGRVVSFPTKETGCSKIMIEAFKKWVLVSLLSEGNLPTTSPPHVSAPTTRIFGTLCRPYVDLAMAFETNNAQQLKSDVEKHTQVWSDDGNIGLVEEVIASYQKWRVLSLQDIYTEISIPEIRQQTKSAETGEILKTDEDVEALIQNMIIDGMLKGVIEKNDDGTNFLIFLSPTTHLSEQEFDEEAVRAGIKLDRLRAVLGTTNERLGSSKEYIKWITKEIKRDKSGESQDPTLGFESQIDDEDLMGRVPSI